MSCISAARGIWADGQYHAVEVLARYVRGDGSSFSTTQRICTTYEFFRDDYRFFVGIGDFLSRLKRRQPKPQVNLLAKEVEPSSCASSYQPGNVTIACSKRPYTGGDKRFD